MSSLVMLEGDRGVRYPPFCSLTLPSVEDRLGCFFCVEITVVILNSAVTELFTCQVWYFIKQWFVYLD